MEVSPIAEPEEPVSSIVPTMLSVLTGPVGPSEPVGLVGLSAPSGPVDPMALYKENHSVCKI